MFNFFGCLTSQPEALELILPETYVEYTHRDPETKMLHSKILKWETATSESHYSKWKRMKYKTKDMLRLRQTIRNGSFLDSDFPHRDDSVSSEEPLQPIVWKRVKELVSNPVFCTPETVLNFEKVPISNKLLKEALTFMYQTHSAKFKQLLSDDYSSSGIYQFKLYRNGIIENVIIDDYVPTVLGSPLMCGPVRDREIFLMLLEKAMAKICGSYEKIPEELEEILEMLFCGPLRKTKIEELSDREQVRSTIEHTVRSKGVAGFMAKREPKIRNFGILERELYTVLDHYSVQVESQGLVFLLELQGPKKVATWNGRFSHNDSIWERVSPQVRSTLFKKLKENRSFFVPLSDVVRIFEHLIAFDGTEIHNKDWIQSNSERDYPSYCVFDAQQEDDIFLRVSTLTKVRTTLIVARFHDKNDYEYVGGAFHPDENSVECTVRVSAGRYILAVLHDWEFTNTGPYSIFLSSNTHVSLHKSPDNVYSNLLEIMFRRQSRALREGAAKQENFSYSKYYSVCNLAPQLGLVYMHVDIGSTNRDKLLIRIDEKILDAERWEMMEPHRSQKLVDLDRAGRSDVVFILKNMMFLQDHKRFFPSTAFKIIE